MRNFVVCLLVAGGVAATSAARADEILEEGDGYYVTRLDPNAGGAVYLRVDYTTAAVRTTVLRVEAAPGWTYRVTAAGGVNSAVEVRFESPQYQSKFKALIKPGKTVVDYGEVKKN